MFGFLRGWGRDGRASETSPDAASTLPAHRRLRTGRSLVNRRARRSGQVGHEARVRPGLDFSLTGLVYSSMMMFLGLAAINSQANPLFGVFGMMVGVLLISGVISRIVLRGVSIERRLPAAAQVGRPVRIRYLVSNRKRFWPTFSLTIAELDAGGTGGIFDRQPHAYVLHAASGMSADVAADVVPQRRGWVELDRVQLATSFPFGFIKRAVIRRYADRLLVGPPRAALEPTALTRFLAAESSGLSQRLRRGGSDELVGLREYRPGDAPRTIHWRRSARTGNLGSGTAVATRRHETDTGLVVREMRRAAPPRLVVLVDTFAPPDADGEALGRVEKNLSVAASLVAGAGDRGLSVGLVLRGPGGIWLETKPDRGKRHSSELLRALAEASRNDAADLRALVNAGVHLAKGDTTGVVVTADLQDDLGRSVAGSGAGNLHYVSTTSPGLARLVLLPDNLDWAAMAQPN